ncbi:DUF305 domain-containing protein [Streptomyces sp. NPDC087532]|uniref:DUF305 domain-containing protein n=1 Tax=unclassified Streptomyces TaxID=2593676 RepID=UPI003322F152
MADAPMTGDADRDFAAMMVPHHQGAVAMAKAVLEHGKDPVPRRLAEEIIVTQQRGIGVLRSRLAATPVAHRDASQAVTRGGGTGPHRKLVRADGRGRACACHRLGERARRP